MKLEVAIDKYTRVNGGPPDERVIGYLRKNAIEINDISQIDAVGLSLTKAAKGTLLGEGDRFSQWCSRLGREDVPAEVVSAMNVDPANSRQIVLSFVPKYPRLYRSYSTYKSGRMG